MKPLSLEDRVLLKRMDKNHLRREEGTRKLLVTNKKAIIPMGDGVITNTEAPEWLQLYLQKIPSFDKEKARGNTVDEVTDILARATIPSLRTFVKPYSVCLICLIQSSISFPLFVFIFDL